MDKGGLIALARGVLAKTALIHSHGDAALRGRSSVVMVRAANPQRAHQDATGDIRAQAVYGSAARLRHRFFNHSSPCPRLSACRHAASSSGGILFET